MSSYPPSHTAQIWADGMDRGSGGAGGAGGEEDERRWWWWWDTPFQTWKLLDYYLFISAVLSAPSGGGGGGLKARKGTPTACAGDV